MNKELILVLGGARSGKSAWALRYTEENYNSRLFIATAEVKDAEMEKRVRLHKEARGDKWKLVEEPLEIAQAIEAEWHGVEAVLVDCLTVWLSNVIIKKGEDEVAPYVDRLLDTLAQRKCSIISVANEVGTGVVPEHALGRKFRDFAGILNQRIAASADRVVFTVAGLPLCLKGTLEKTSRI
jgi:adenosylcobinamide kinase/adenosylcobinamide-phosphate guanylyltransferase